MSYYVPHYFLYKWNYIMFTAYDLSYLTDNHLLPQFMQNLPSGLPASTLALLQTILKVAKGTKEKASYSILFNGQMGLQRVRHNCATEHAQNSAE